MIQSIRPWLSFCLALVLATLCRSSSETEMERSARGLIEALTPELRSKLCFDFETEARVQWSYLPGNRAGLRLKDMNVEQRQAAHALLRALLSSQGYMKVNGIMALEPVLAQLERAAGGNGATRDAEQYSFAMFGEPSPAKPWGWRMEGHHVVLTFTSIVDAGMAVTPMFLGTHPAEVTQGPSAGLRVLAAEEDLALAFMRQLDEAERNAAVIPGAVPGDVLAGPARTAASIEAQGVPLSELEATDMALLRSLVAEFTGNFHAPTAVAAQARIFEGDLAQMRFAWWGALEPRTAHAWRLVTATSVLEFDNRESGSGHVHLVWRDATRDHGADLLQQHLRERHGKNK